MENDKEFMTAVGRSPIRMLLDDEAALFNWNYRFYRRMGLEQIVRDRNILGEILDIDLRRFGPVSNQARLNRWCLMNAEIARRIWSPSEDDSHDQ